jgi:molecular chaperone GrpE
VQTNDFDENAVTAEVNPEPDRTSVRRAVNELEAARARVERDARRAGDETRSKLVAQLLPVLDNLDRTIRAARDHGETPAMLDGVIAVRAQLETVLRGYGVERLEAVGAQFDPSVHEAIAVIPIRDPARHGLVIDQAEPGYRFGDSLLRPAKVVVARLVV